MKKIVLFFALLLAGNSFAQSANINSYKYVVIPERFDFFKEPNKYNLNSLTKMAFEKYGFTVLYSNEQMPPDIALNRCGALYGDLLNGSGMLTTTVSIVLKDCSGKVLFTSEKGKSKEKDYKKAYYEATREAAASLASLNYQYEAGAATATSVQQQGATVTTITPVNSQPVTAVPVNNENQLFAQPITNGYQLVDSTPKIVLKMYKTSQPDSYSAQGDGKNGVVFKKGNEWFFEYYQNDKLISEKLNVKF
jgi:hypothetical protein